jgi:hypothetical protein
LNVVVVFPSAFTNERALAHSIKKVAKELTSITLENNLIVCESSDVVELAYKLSTMFGIERVAVAQKVSNSFSDLLDAISEVGSRVIVPGDRFFVKVIRQSSVKHDYVSRDIEFAASGALAEKLAPINARPARKEQEANRTVLAVICEESAYICIQVISAPGGLVAGSQGTVLSSMHGSLSFLSCLMAAKAGFECSSIVLPYTDERDLEINAKLVQRLAIRTGIKKQTILLTPINIPLKGSVSLLLKEQIVSKILIQSHNKDDNNISNNSDSDRKTRNRRIIFPLTAAIHPIWFIESIMQESLSAGKTPFVPLAFLSSELVTLAIEAGIDLLDLSPSSLSSSVSSAATAAVTATTTITRTKLQNYHTTVDSETRSALKNAKRVKLKVGPNYVHDIIDSI